MSMQDLEKAFELIELNNDKADFEGPKPEELILKAEQALGFTFPPTYRRFLSHLGCGGFGGTEIYGAITDEFSDSGIPDAIWLTLRKRHDENNPSSLIIIAETGDGGDYAIDCSRFTDESENPIVEWWSPDQIIVDSANDFGEFFLQRIQEVLNRFE